jgi:hypothetical protein
MNHREKTTKNWISPKTEYKLNVYKKGTIYADSVFELIYKIVTKKYIKNENSSLDKGRKPRKPKKLDVSIGPLNS